jgi:hypothetical protein
MRYLRTRLAEGCFPLALQYQKHQTAEYQSAKKNDRRQENGCLCELFQNNEKEKKVDY